MPGQDSFPHNFYELFKIADVHVPLTVFIVCSEIAMAIYIQITSNEIYNTFKKLSDITPHIALIMNKCE